MDPANPADITIITADGFRLGSHRRILVPGSPILGEMIRNSQCKENGITVIEMPEMSLEACQAFVHYLDGYFSINELLNHRRELLIAAVNYGVDDLRRWCEVSLSEDIDTTNVLGRLEDAHVNGLPMLKARCLYYLVNLDNIYEIRNNFDTFVRNADREVLVDIFHQILDAWKAV